MVQCNALLTESYSKANSKLPRVAAKKNSFTSSGISNLDHSSLENLQSRHWCNSGNRFNLLFLECRLQGVADLKERVCFGSYWQSQKQFNSNLAVLATWAEL